MSLELNAGLNNLLPSEIFENKLELSNLSWFDGCLTVNYSGNIRVASLLDFGLDQYSVVIAATKEQNGYVMTGYVMPGYVMPGYSTI